MSDKLLTTKDINDESVTIDTRLRLHGHLTKTKPHYFDYIYMFGIVNVVVGSNTHEVKVFIPRDKTNLPSNRKIKIHDKMTFSCDVYKKIEKRKGKQSLPTAKNVVFPPWVKNEAIGCMASLQNQKFGNGGKNGVDEEAMDFLLSGSKSIDAIGDFEPLDDSKKQTSSENLCKIFVANTAVLLGNLGTDIIFDGTKTAETFFKNSYSNLQTVDNQDLDILMSKLGCDTASALFEHKNVVNVLKNSAKVRTKVEFQRDGSVLVVYAVKTVAYLKHGFK